VNEISPLKKKVPSYKGHIGFYHCGHRGKCTCYGRFFCDCVF